MAIESKNNGKVIVVFDDEVRQQQVPLFCKECQQPMKTIDDSISYRSKGCCSKCDINWSYVLEVDWQVKEKHPSVVFPELWDEYIKNRELQSRPILIFK
jgi:hypothetical protein